MKTAVAALMLLVLAGGTLYAQPADQPPPIPAEEQPEVLTSGPVHEAFAEPVNLQVQAGLVAPEQPPANIEEVPPVDRPQGDQFVWVPGYWAWDADRHGYIWVSACWRAAPPKMYWVPGYWARVPEGWEWIPGFWAPAGAQKIEYLPAPPVIDNAEPIGPAPSVDVLWVPPCYYWRDGHYLLRAGYWVHALPGWIWVPAHFTWTPRGYVFVEGHWDYGLDRRGVLFAPVYLPRHVRERPHFAYSLSITVDLGALRVNLFTCPRYNHYYFGDFYDAAYVRVGIYPRCEVERVHTWCDPLYQHDRWRNLKTRPDWVEHEWHEYDLRRADRDLRPPRTYHEMMVRERRLPEAERKTVQMARPMSAVVAGKSPLRFQQVKSSERRQLARQANDVHKFSDQRTRWESPASSKREIQPLPPSRGAAPSAERKEPERASLERKAAMPSAKGTPKPAPGERKEAAGTATKSAPMDHKQAAPAPSGRSPSSATPAPTGPARGPAAPGPRSSAPGRGPAQTEHASPFVPPRALKMTKPETVKIPRPPVVGKSVPESKKEAAPPARPTEERQSPRDTKGKDADKGKGNARSK